MRDQKLLADRIHRSFRIDDVTEVKDSKLVADDILTESYIKLSSGVSDVRDVRSIVCDDPYHRYGLSRTLLLTGWNPTIDALEPIGTVRIIRGSETAKTFGLPPLEAMGLITPGSGWNSFNFQYFDVNEAVEGGRTAIRPACRTGAAKEAGLPLLALRALVVEGFRIAQEQWGKTQYWGILPSYMIKRFEMAGLRVIRAPDMSLLKQNASLFEMFDRYWLHSEPAFCRVMVR